MEKERSRDPRKMIWMIVAAMALLVTFFQFSRVNLMTSGNWALDIVRYQEAGRQQRWDALIEKSGDPIVQDTYADAPKALQDLGLYGFINAVPYFLYSFLGIKGVALWLSQKILVSLMGAGTILVVFLIAELFYGPVVAFMAAVLTAFSPHFWIWFNVDSALLRSYNIFLSLSAMAVFLRLIVKKEAGGWKAVALSALMWSLSFVFFHIGSFMMPLVAFTYCVFYIRGMEKKERARVVKMFFLSLGAGLCLALVLQVLRLWWFRLPVSAPWEWLAGYWAKGAEASHSTSGIVAGHLGHLFVNVKNHIMGVFVNGRTPSDWHYGISPPGIASCYTPAITLFFVFGLISAFKEKRKGDILFLCWFILFFFIYSFLIVVRQKNISLEVPAIFILASRSLLSLVPWTVSFLKKFLLEKWVDRAVIGRVLTVLLLGPAIIQGAYFIHRFLPMKGFYDNAAFSGTYQLYRHLAMGGYTRNTKIYFTMPQSTIGPIMMRLFSDGVMPVGALSQNGIAYPPTEEAWRQFEEKALPESDKIVYCFMSYENHAGNIQYVTDEPYRLAFEQAHPDIKPFVIMGLDKAPLWRVYSVRRQITQAAESPGENLAPELLSDYMIGSAFKTLAKAYLAALNIDHFKKNNAKVIQKMNDGKFEKKMRMVRPYIIHLPQSLRDRCGIKDVMTRQDALEGLKRLTKPLLLEIVEAIPNPVIAGAFRSYQEEDADNRAQKDILGQVNDIWAKAMENSKKLESAPEAP